LDFFFFQISRSCFPFAWTVSFVDYLSPTLHLHFLFFVLFFIIFYYFLLFFIIFIFLFLLLFGYLFLLPTVTCLNTFYTLRMSFNKNESSPTVDGAQRDNNSITIPYVPLLFLSPPPLH